ncbi:MAG: dienelactone hydrolase [Parasphingorhabdus sp.]|jgi:dienelactone hydrolase
MRNLLLPRRFSTGNLTVGLLLTMLIVNTAIAHHVPLPETMSKAQAAWLWGFYTVPASITKDSSPYWYSYEHTDVNKINSPAWIAVAQKHIKKNAKVPAALVMHGCSGLIRSPTAYRVLLMQNGYAVFEPDSFARPGHTCNFETLYRRTEDLAYAYEQISKLPWVDSDRIVLLGISQGGRAVAKWNQPGFAAHIILDNNCSRGIPKAPTNTPVLSIVGSKDERLQGSSCDVSQHAEGSKSIVIEGAPHGISDYEETEQAIVHLLNRL